jgi:L-fuconolactonase
MIDGHVYFWKYTKIKNGLITNEMKVLQKDFLPVDLANENKNDLKGIVAVQAHQTEDETMYLLNLAERNPVIKGVLGWIDLQNKNIEKKVALLFKAITDKEFQAYCSIRARRILY